MAAVGRPSFHRDSNPSFDLLVDDAAIAGIVGQLAENFEANFDADVKKVQPVAHCWTPTGDIYCGCQGGQLLKVDTENQNVNMIDHKGL